MLASYNIFQIIGDFSPLLYLQSKPLMWMNEPWMFNALHSFHSWISKAIETVSSTACGKFITTTTTKETIQWEKQLWLIRAWHIFVYCNYKCWGQHEILKLRNLWIALHYRHMYIYYNSTVVEKIQHICEWWVLVCAGSSVLMWQVGEVLCTLLSFMLERRSPRMWRVSHGSVWLHGDQVGKP